MRPLLRRLAPDLLAALGLLLLPLVLFAPVMLGSRLFDDSVFMPMAAEE